MLMSIKHAIALALLLGNLSVAGTARAAGMQTYRNLAHGYRLQYPATWTRKPHAAQSDVELVAPDTNAIVTASATAGSATQAEIKAQQAKVLKGAGQAQGPLSYKLASIHGYTYAVSEIVTTTAEGKMLDMVLVDTVHGGYVYDFEAFLRYNGPTYKAEVKTVQQILNSIQLTK
jgi:hypothetical protein